jgi:hypothetical protein
MKEVYQLRENPTLVVAMSHSQLMPVSPEEFLEELESMRTLERNGFPVVRTYGLITVGTELGLLQNFVEGAVKEGLHNSGPIRVA